MGAHPLGIGLLILGVSSILAGLVGDGLAVRLMAALTFGLSYALYFVLRDESRVIVALRVGGAYVLAPIALSVVAPDEALVQGAFSWAGLLTAMWMGSVMAGLLAG